MIAPETERRIDRLVDDELGPEERRALLASLDAEPDGWRRCALAFLEAQCWRASMTPPTRESPGPLTRRSRPRRALIGLAASLLATFALGWAAGGAAPARRPLLAERPPPQTRAPVRSASLPVGPIARQPRPVPARDERWLRQPPPPFPDSVRRDWERRGFEVEPQRGLMAVEWKDGRRLAVPVDAVKLRYVGNRTY